MSVRGKVGANQNPATWFDYTVVIDPETGQPVSYGGGGGGAATIADGADVAQGSIGDLAYDGTSPNTTVIGALKGVWTLLSQWGALTDAAWDGTGTPISWGAVWKAIAISALNPNPTPVSLAQAKYEPVGASQTDAIIGTTGVVGDYLAALVIQPATTAPGSVVLKDGSTTIFTWPGTSSYPAHLSPITIPLGIKAVNAGFKVTTGANVSVLAEGEFA